jgi:hypothetical protein
MIMKPVTLLFFIAFSVFCMTGCNNQATTLTQTDSANVAGDYLKHHPDVATGGAARDSFYQPRSVAADRLVVGQDSLDKMRHAYDSIMTWHIPNPYGGWASGFVVSAADFADLVKLANAGKVTTFGFHFAVRNFNEFAQGAKPLYTMEIVPVGPGNVPFPKGLATPATTSYGYDFVDPCPGGLGCPN